MVFCHFRRKTTSKDMYHQTKMCHYNPKTTNHHWYGTMAPISFGRFVTIQPYQNNTHSEPKQQTKNDTHSEPK
jgi:surface antigen